MKIEGREERSVVVHGNFHGPPDLRATSPAAVAMAIAPPTVTVMAMVIIPVVVGCRTNVVCGSGFAD
jgi:hypothetical protein